MRVEASGGTVIHRSPRDVARYVLDPTTLPQWRGEVTAVRRVGAGDTSVGARYRVRLGAHLMRTDEVAERTADERIVLRTRDGDRPTTLDLTVTPDGDGSLVRAHVTGEPPAGIELLGVLGARSARRHLTTDLARLKRILEGSANPL